MNAKPRNSRSVKANATKLRWASVYVLVSEDAREMALVSLADGPQQLRDFMLSVEAWLESIRSQVDHVDALNNDGDGEGVQ